MLAIARMARSYNGVSAYRPVVGWVELAIPVLPWTSHE